MLQDVIDRVQKLYGIELLDAINHILRFGAVSLLRSCQLKLWQKEATALYGCLFIDLSRGGAYLHAIYAHSFGRHSALAEFQRRASLLTPLVIRLAYAKKFGKCRMS